MKNYEKPAAQLTTSKLASKRIVSQSVVQRITKRNKTLDPLQLSKAFASLHACPLKRESSRSVQFKNLPKSSLADPSLVPFLSTTINEHNLGGKICVKIISFI